MAQLSVAESFLICSISGKPGKDVVHLGDLMGRSGSDTVGCFRHSHKRLIGTDHLDPKNLSGRWANKLEKQAGTNNKINTFIGPTTADGTHSIQIMNFMDV